MFFSGRIVISCDDKNESVGYHKPKLGAVEESGRREAENIEDGNVYECKEEKGKQGSCTRFAGLLIRIIFFGLVEFHCILH